MQVEIPQSSWMRQPDLPMFDPARHPVFDPSTPHAAGMLRFFERLQAHLQQHVDVAELGYEAEIFRSFDRAGAPIYHTNVLLSVGERAAVVGRHGEM